MLIEHGGIGQCEFTKVTRDVFNVNPVYTYHLTDSNWLMSLKKWDDNFFLLCISGAKYRYVICMKKEVYRDMILLKDFNTVLAEVVADANFKLQLFDNGALDMGGGLTLVDHVFFKRENFNLVVLAANSEAKDGKLREGYIVEIRMPRVQSGAAVRRAMLYINDKDGSRSAEIDLYANAGTNDPLKFRLAIAKGLLLRSEVTWVTSMPSRDHEYVFQLKHCIAHSK